MLKKLLLVFALCALVIPLTVTAQDADEWWDNQVFYQVFVRSFYDSDGDGIGDIQGLISQLDYLNDGDPTTTDDLGVTALWLMPINPATSYHGYDVLDYYDVNPDFGTIEDFRELIAEAEARGMRVIIDLVFNHSGVEHPWFLDSAANPDGEFADWYIWEDENPGFRGPDNQVVWHGRAGRYYYGLFWGGMPDLNYTNPDVTAEMYDIATFWLEEMGVHGFRLDAVKYVIEEGTATENTSGTHEWLQGFYDHIKSVDADALIVGEIWDSSFLIAPYVGDEVDIAFEFDLARSLVRSASFGITGPTLNTFEVLQEVYEPGNFATFLTNHDQDRMMNQVRENPVAAKLGASLLLTLPGTPFIYYGEEIGMVGTKPDEFIRTPMQWDDTPDTAGFTTGTPWQPVNTDFVTVNVAAQNTDPDSLLNHYRRLVQARLSSPALMNGEMVVVESTNRRVFSFLRVTDEQTALVLINMDESPSADYNLTLSASGLSDESTLSLLLGDGDPVAPELTEAGGFAAYLPVPELPANSVTVILFD